LTGISSDGIILTSLNIINYTTLERSLKMAVKLNDMEQKIANEMLPLPLVYPHPDTLFTGRICDLTDGAKIETELDKACEDGDVKKVKEILETHNIGVNAIVREDETLFDAAAYWKQPRVLRFLLNEPSIQVSQKNGMAALYSALDVDCKTLQVVNNFANANYEMAAVLIQAGVVDINHVQHHNHMESNRDRVSTLLMRAWLKGDQELANRLVSWGANIKRSEQCYNENQAKNNLSSESWKKFQLERKLSEVETPESRLHYVEGEIKQKAQAEQQVRDHIALSKQYRDACLNGPKFLGIECARLQNGKDTGCLRLATFLVDRKSWAERAFMWGYEMMRKRLSDRLSKPVFVHLPEKFLPAPPKHSAAGDTVLELISQMEASVTGTQGANGRDKEIAENTTLAIEEAATHKQFHSPQDIPDIEVALDALQLKYAAPGNTFYAEISQRVTRCKVAFGLKLAVGRHLKNLKH
jgi:hypothetical protein